MFLELDIQLEGACITIPAFFVEPSGMTSWARRGEMTIYFNTSLLPFTGKN